MVIYTFLETLSLRFFRPIRVRIPPPSPPSLRVDDRSLVELELYRELNTHLEVLTILKSPSSVDQHTRIRIQFTMGKKSYEPLFVFSDFWPFSAIFRPFLAIGRNSFCPWWNACGFLLFHPVISGFQKMERSQGVYLVLGSRLKWSISTRLLFVQYTRELHSTSFVRDQNCLAMSIFAQT